jgi:hypothetical protein
MGSFKILLHLDMHTVIRSIDILLTTKASIEMRSRSPFYGYMLYNQI